MRNLLGLAVMGAMLWLVWSAEAAPPVKKKAPVKGAAKTSAGKTTAKKAPAGKAPATTAASHKKVPARKPTTWRNRQMTPSTERYREIQGALVAKGYLKSEDANGTWNQNSVDALKRFQAEQNLESSGKINSLSLIALGLGPKRESPTAAATAPKQPQ